MADIIIPTKDEATWTREGFAEKLRLRKLARKAKQPQHRKPKKLVQGVSPRTWPVDQWSNVACCEVDNTLNEGWAENEFKASVTLRCAWEDRFDLIEDIRDISAYPYFRGSDGAGDDDMDICEFDTASIVPFYEKVETTTGDGMYQWKTAHVTINWTTNKAQWRYTEIFEPQVEFRILPDEQFTWIIAGELAELTQKEAPGIQLRGSMYTIQVYNVPDDDMYQRDYFKRVGTVNNKMIHLTSLAQDYEIGQIMLLPAQVDRVVRTNEPWDHTSLDTVFWNMTLKLAIRPTTGGWNKYWKADSTATDKFEYLYKLPVPDPSSPPDPYKSYEESSIEIFLPLPLYTL